MLDRLAAKIIPPHAKWIFSPASCASPTSSSHMWCRVSIINTSSCIFTHKHGSHRSVGYIYDADWRRLGGAIHIWHGEPIRHITAPALGATILQSIDVDDDVIWQRNTRRPSVYIMAGLASAKHRKPYMRGSFAYRRYMNERCSIVDWII